MPNIHTNRKSGFIRRSGVMRRETLWLGGVYQDTAIAAASTALILTALTAAGLALRPFTVVRSRGLLFVSSDQEAGDERQSVAYGACVVSDQAVGIGVTAVPTPATDNDSDLWFVHESLFNNFQFASGVGFDGASGTKYPIDSRAMRKVEDGSDLITVVETSAVSFGTRVLSFNRVLLKLH